MTKGLGCPLNPTLKNCILHRHFILHRQTRPELVSTDVGSTPLIKVKHLITALNQQIISSLAQDSSLSTGHDSAVWEVQFEKDRPDNLYTCSEDGQLLLWNGAALSGESRGLSGDLETSHLGQGLSPSGQGQDPLTSWIQGNK